jgi:hypothetical protein
MITVKEFMYSKNYWHYEDYYPLLIEFAKLHVTEALKAASEHAELDYGNGRCIECGSNKIDEQSILAAYPLDLIK